MLIGEVKKFVCVSPSFFGRVARAGLKEERNAFFPSSKVRTCLATFLHKKKGVEVWVHGKLVS